MQVAPGAWRYAAPVFALAALGLAASPLAGGLLALAGIGVVVFHRDPERCVPEEGVLAPADGRVSVIREEGDRLRVGVYMGVSNVHVNRAPMPGVVESVTHSPGAHRPAFSKDSDRNERVRIDCEAFAVVLIAGAFARRIHPYVEPGDRIARGERVGHVSFGSRADVFFPPEIERADLAVATGDRMVAGETALVETVPNSDSVPTAPTADRPRVQND